MWQARGKSALSVFSPSIIFSLYGLCLIFVSPSGRYQIENIYKISSFLLPFHLSSRRCRQQKFLFIPSQHYIFKLQLQHQKHLNILSIHLFLHNHIISILLSSIHPQIIKPGETFHYPQETIGGTKLPRFIAKDNLVKLSDDYLIVNNLTGYFDPNTRVRQREEAPSPTRRTSEESA